MMVVCECGKEFLSEADPHIVIPSEGYKLYCGCKAEIFNNKTKQEDRLSILEKENEKLKKDIETWENMAHVHAKAMEILEQDRDNLKIQVAINRGI